jgi:predicted TIM-barrel fold metal-dependent hydrolase
MPATSNKRAIDAWAQPGLKHFHFMKTYGREKVLFGTNFPQLPFEKCMEQVGSLDLTDDVRTAFLRENALRVFKLS